MSNTPTNKSMEERAREAWAEIHEVAKATGNDSILFSFDNGYSIILRALQEHESAVAWKRRAEGMKLGNESYARENAQLRADLDRSGREWLELTKDKAALESCIEKLRAVMT